MRPDAPAALQSVEEAAGAVEETPVCPEYGSLSSASPLIDHVIWGQGGPTKNVGTTECHRHSSLRNVPSYSAFYDVEAPLSQRYLHKPALPQSRFMGFGCRCCGGRALRLCPKLGYRLLPWYFRFRLRESFCMTIPTLVAWVQLRPTNGTVKRPI